MIGLVDLEMHLVILIIKEHAQLIRHCALHLTDTRPVYIHIDHPVCRAITCHLDALDYNGTALKIESCGPKSAQSILASIDINMTQLEPSEAPEGPSLSELLAEKDGSLRLSNLDDDSVVFLYIFIFTPE